MLQSRFGRDRHGVGGATNLAGNLCIQGDTPPFGSALAGIAGVPGLAEQRHRNELDGVPMPAPLRADTCQKESSKKGCTCRNLSKQPALKYT